MRVQQLRFFANKVVAVPQMGDSITEGTIQEIMKGPGEFVKADEVIAIIETDKVSVDINAPSDGVIGKFFAEIGDIVEVGANLYEIDPEAKGGAAPAKEAAPKAEAAAEAKKEEAPAKKEEPAKQAAPKAAAPATP